MEKFLPPVVLILILSLGTINAQVIPEELLGDWIFEYELNACGDIIASGCDMEGLNISQYNENTDFDTLTITEFKFPNESYSARYHMTVISGEPERYQFARIDSVATISPLEFHTNYDSDSLVFNWTTTDPGIPTNFELLNPDSLVFHWSTNCQLCDCAGEIHFSRNLTSTNDELVVNNDHWKLFPNPVKGFVSLIKTDTQINVDSRISLIDSKGVIHEEFTSSDFNLRIQVGNLNSGLYYLKIENKNGMVIKKLVVVD